jgi:hypothetical protein
MEAVCHSFITIIINFAVVSICIFCSLLQESCNHVLFGLKLKFPLCSVTKYDFEVSLHFFYSILMDSFSVVSVRHVSSSTSVSLMEI